MTDDQDLNESPNIEGKEQILQKLKSALRRDGDFPATARVVIELKRLVSDPRTTANQITELILKEPSLVTRILHLVNSSYYQRARPIMTVSQAVVQVGMKPLSDLCAGLILLQRFIPQARKGGPFAGCLQKTIVTALLASQMANDLDVGTSAQGTRDERGYLVGSFAELGTLLLGYYFPQVYEAAHKRAQSKHQPIGTALKEITGLTPFEISSEVMGALGLPEFYKEVLKSADQDPVVDVSKLKADRREIGSLGKALYGAEAISDAIVFSKSKDNLDRVLERVQKQTGLAAPKLNNVVGALQENFKEYCSTIELNLGDLPDFVGTYGDQVQSKQGDKFKDGGQSAINHFIEEIKQAIENGEPPSTLITSAMETLAWGLKFDRVLLLFLAQGKKSLAGRLVLGKSQDINPRDIERSLNDPSASKRPEICAFLESKPIYGGISIFEGGTNIGAIPVGFSNRSIGVIYFDRIGSKSELTEPEKIAIKTITDLLDKAVRANA